MRALAGTGVGVRVRDWGAGTGVGCGKASKDIAESPTALPERPHYKIKDREIRC